MPGLLSAIALAAIAGVASAAEPPAISGRYTIDPYHTQPTVEWDHFGISRITGRFDRTRGALDLDVARRRAKVSVEIDAASLSTGVPLLDQRLKSAAFFNVAKYPKITFRAEDFRFTGDTLHSVAGDLTIHGVTRKVVLTARKAHCVTHRNPTMPLPACGANLETQLNRSDYGVGLFTPLVADRVTIRIGVEAILGSEGIEGQFGALTKPPGPAGGKR
ncbi:MAG: YceI family protein [Caulobacteraceae bacterium]